MVDPRTTLAMVALLYVVVAGVTLRYPPQYLAVPFMWSFIAATVALVSLIAIGTHGRRATAYTGAAAVFAALTRCAALVVQSILGPTMEPSQSSRWVAASMWLALGYLIWLVWVRIMLPWSATMNVEHRERGPG